MDALQPSLTSLLDELQTILAANELYLNHPTRTAEAEAEYRRRRIDPLAKGSRGAKDTATARRVAAVANVMDPRRGGRDLFVLVFPHGVRPRFWVDASAGFDGTTNVWNDAQHVGRNAADAFVLKCVVVDRNSDWAGSADTHGSHVGCGWNPRDSVLRNL
jgi:hypothetical protein